MQFKIYRIQHSDGVPQGSVLGLTLYNIAMSTIHEIQPGKNSNITSYANDVMVVVGFNKTEEI